MSVVDVIALPTMIVIPAALLKACNSSSGWTPARWCCPDNSNRHSWATPFACVQCKRANGAPAAAVSFPRVTKFTCKPSLEPTVTYSDLTENKLHALVQLKI